MAGPQCHLLVPGLPKGTLSMAEGDPFLFGAEKLSVGQLKGFKRRRLCWSQSRIRLIVTPKAFFDAQRPVCLDVAWCHQQGLQVWDHGAGAKGS